MPALLEAHKLSAKAAAVGFDWPNIDGLFDKLREEADELRTEVSQIPPDSDRQRLPDELRQRLEEEVGDLFFVLVNMARYLSLDSESALKKSNRKFKRRFQWMEEELRASGRAPQSATSEELEALWAQAKRQERASH
jgi:uncharacterized protein YabN with tetrapyrrole methylase and pyrophosphatase domain